MMKKLLPFLCASALALSLTACAGTINNSTADTASNVTFTFTGSGVTAAGVRLPPDVAEVVSFYGYHGYVNQRELQFVREEELWEYLGADLVLVGRATDVLSLPKVQGVRLAELERGRTGISVKMLIKVCKVLGLSADYVLFGDDRPEDSKRLDAIRRIDEKYLPLLDKVIAELLTLSGE